MQDEKNLVILKTANYVPMKWYQALCRASGN